MLGSSSGAYNLPGVLCFSARKASWLFVVKRWLVRMDSDDAASPFLHSVADLFVEQVVPRALMAPSVSIAPVWKIRKISPYPLLSLE